MKQNSVEYCFSTYKSTSGMTQTVECSVNFVLTRFTPGPSGSGLCMPLKRVSKFFTDGIPASTSVRDSGKESSVSSPYNRND